jgi:hypothetical protein
MKRFFIFSIAFALVLAFGAPYAMGQTDPIGVVKIKAGDPIHIACWMVIAGPDASLGTDTKRGVEIAIDDKAVSSSASHQTLPRTRLWC